MDDVPPPPSVRQKVDRVVFETQAALLSCRSVNGFDALTANARRWLQPRHFAEIVEERSTEGVCGYPPCAKPVENRGSSSSGNNTLRISYKEKRLYEVDGSVKFCCKECLKLAAAFEASLDDTNPESREGAHEIAANDVSELNERVLLGTRRGSPPSFNNGALEASGAVKETGSTISEITSALQLLKRNGPSEANAMRGSNSSVALPTSRFLPSTGRTPPILAYGPTTGSPQAQKETAIQSKADAKDAATIEPDDVSGKPRQGPPDMGTLPPSVSLAAAEESRPARSSAPKPPSRVMNALVVETDRALPVSKVSPAAAPAVAQLSPVGAASVVSPLTHASPPPRSSGSLPGASSSDMTRLAKRITFAEDTAGPAPLTNVAADPDNNVRAHVEDEYDDSLLQGDDTETSLFMLLWTALDDLFGNERCASVLLSPHSGVFVGGAVTSDTAGEVIAVDDTQRAKRRSVGQFVERGFAIAEGHLRPDTFLSTDSHARYVAAKTMFLEGANFDGPCPPLSGKEWALLALLIVDTIVCGRQLLTKDDVAAWQAWKAEVDACVATITRSSSDRARRSARSLRDGDFVLLQSFFPRIVGH